jgi:hypothetical protein
VAHRGLCISEAGETPALRPTRLNPLAVDQYVVMSS